MNYINLKGVYGVETIENLKDLNLKEKRELLKEYKISDTANYYYFSQRCTKDF